jgi:hypothetical protein
MKRRLDAATSAAREAVHQPLTYRLAVDFDVAAKILLVPRWPPTRAAPWWWSCRRASIDELDAAEAWLERQGLRLDRSPPVRSRRRSGASRCRLWHLHQPCAPAVPLSCDAPTWQLGFDAQRLFSCASNASPVVRSRRFPSVWINPLTGPTRTQLQISHVSRPSLNTTTRQVLGLLLLPFRAPLLVLLFRIAVWSGCRWLRSTAHATLAEGPLLELFWSVDFLVRMRCW